MEDSQLILVLSHHLYIVMSLLSNSGYFLVGDPEGFSGYVSPGPQTSISLETSPNFPRMGTLAAVAPEME